MEWKVEWKTIDSSKWNGNKVEWKWNGKQNVIKTEPSKWNGNKIEWKWNGKWNGEISHGVSGMEKKWNGKWNGNGMENIGS